MVTFRFTVNQFERLLTVMLADETPDDLTSLVLMACTRVHDGIISVPVHPGEAEALVNLVGSAAVTRAEVADVAALMHEQMAAP